MGSPDVGGREKESLLIFCEWSELRKHGFHHGIGGARAPQARRALADGGEQVCGGFVMKHGIGKFRHHFFEAAAQLERGNHGVQRVAVARIDDVLENFYGLVFEFGQGRCRASFEPGGWNRARLRAESGSCADEGVG